MKDAAQIERHRLTPVQREILELVADGKRYGDIAIIRGGSADSLKQQGSKLISALDAETLAHAVAIAFREGLLQ